MEVAAERAACVAAEANQFAAFNVLAGHDLALGHVGVVGLEAVGVVNDDEVAVAAVAFGDAHDAIEGGVDGFACWLSQVEAVMEASASRAEVA